MGVSITDLKGQTMSDKIELLRKMIAEGRFHHATHRHNGPRLSWGLYVYEVDNPNGVRFFERYKLAMTFYDDIYNEDPQAREEQDQAWAICNVHGGVCVNSYNGAQ